VKPASGVGSGEEKDRSAVAGVQCAPWANAAVPKTACYTPRTLALSHQTLHHPMDAEENRIEVFDLIYLATFVQPDVDVSFLPLTSDFPSSVSGKVEHANRTHEPNKHNRRHLRLTR